MEQADNPVLPAAATAQPMAMQLALERMERRLIEERMERRLDAERAARNLLQERMARKQLLEAARAESEKKILEERMARKQLKAATGELEGIRKATQDPQAFLSHLLEGAMGEFEEEEDDY